MPGLGRWTRDESGKRPQFYPQIFENKVSVFAVVSRGVRVFHNWAELLVSPQTPLMTTATDKQYLTRINQEFPFLGSGGDRGPGLTRA